MSELLSRLNVFDTIHLLQKLAWSEFRAGLKMSRHLTSLQFLRGEEVGSGDFGAFPFHSGGQVLDG